MGHGNSEHAIRILGSYLCSASGATQPYEEKKTKIKKFNEIVEKIAFIHQQIR